MTSLPREFRKTPLILLSCIAVLAIGIGGATAAFSALYTIVLRPLSYPNPQQLVAVHSQFPRLQMDHSGVSPLDYLDLPNIKTSSATPELSFTSTSAAQANCTPRK